MTRPVNTDPDTPKWILMSASYPDRERDQRYAEGTSVRDISNAVVELAKAVLDAGGSLVFGGHPTISPLVLQVAEGLSSGRTQSGYPRIRIYQSDVFSMALTRQEASEKIGLLDVGEKITTLAAGHEKPRFRNGVLDINSVRDSLTLMRHKMFADNLPLGAVFIGGMEGIEAEYSIAQEYANVRRYLVAAPGGAAGQLSRSNPVCRADASPILQKALATSRLYPWIMRLILEDLGLRRSS